MAFVVTLLAYLAAFAVCLWSGQQLANHYQDQREILAVLAIGVCMLGLLALLQRLGVSTGTVSIMGLGGAGIGGLFAGYLTSRSII
jgi:uncharacterized membrane protein YcjF (UPF0283 family)